MALAAPVASQKDSDKYWYVTVVIQGKDISETQSLVIDENPIDWLISWRKVERSRISIVYDREITRQQYEDMKSLILRGVTIGK